LIYCCIDTETTAQAAQLMLGIANNLNWNTQRKDAHHSRGQTNANQTRK
jgi:hypothetical protein